MNIRSVQISTKGFITTFIPDANTKISLDFGNQDVLNLDIPKIEKMIHLHNLYKDFYEKHSNGFYDFTV